jgi:hypothetical protein
MRPKDFWKLTITEFWWLVDARQPAKMYGSTTEREIAQIYEETYGDAGLE